MKKLLLSLTLVLILAITFIGCGPAPTSSKPWMRIFGGSVGATMNFKQELVGQVLRQAHPEWNVRVISGITGAGSWDLMYKHGIELITESIIDCISGNTEGKFTGIDVPKMDVRYLYATDVYTFHLVLNESIPINSIDEFVTKKYKLNLGIGRPGTAPNNLVNLALQAGWGVSFKDLEAWGCKLYPGSTADGANQIVDGIADGILDAGGIPQVSIEEIASKRKLKVVGVGNSEVVAKLLKAGFTDAPINPGEYSFATKEVPTVGVPQVSMVRADMDEKIVNGIVKAVWEAKDFLRNNYNGFKPALEPEFVKSMNSTYSQWLHPVAKKYWESIGIK
jgi:TRAP transporter TAXI family solute receptor